MMIEITLSPYPGFRSLIQTGGRPVQMCKPLEATVIGTVSTYEKAAVARQLGCYHVIMYTKEEVLAEVMRLTDGKGCHGVLSGIGQATFETDHASTRRKGTLVSFEKSSGAVAPLKLLDLSKKNVKIVRPSLANYIFEREEFELRTGELLELIGSGIVKVLIGGEYTLETLN